MLYLALIFIQTYLLHYFFLRTTLGIVGRINAAYFILTYTKRYFKNIFVKQLVVLSTISLFYSVIQIFLPSAFHFLNNHSFLDNTFFLKNNIIYVFSPEGYRNRGPFWEPGAFSGFLIVTFIFYHENFKPFSFKDRKDIILLLALITTFSTTGYLAFIIIFGVITIANNKKRPVLLKVLLLPLLILFVYFAAISVKFIGKKISHQWEYALNYKSGRAKYNAERFVVLFRDFNQFEERPFFGWGNNDKMRLVNPSSLRANITNGTSDFFVRYGIIGFGLFSIALYYGLRRGGFSKKYSFFSIFIIYFIAFSEAYFKYTFFLGLPFLDYCAKRVNS